MELEDLIIGICGGVPVCYIIASIMGSGVWSLRLHFLSKELKEYSLEHCTGSLQKYLKGERDFSDLTEEDYDEAQRKLRGFYKRLDEIGGLRCPLRNYNNPHELVRLRNLEYQRDLME